MFETNSVKQLQIEINFIKNEKDIIDEIFIYILSCRKIAIPVEIYFARRPKKEDRVMFLKTAETDILLMNKNVNTENTTPCFFISNKQRVFHPFVIFLLSHEN